MRFGNSSNRMRKKRFIIKIPDIKFLAIFAITCMLSIANAIAPSFALAYVGGVAPSVARAQDVVPDSITVATSVEYPPGVMNGDGVNSHMFTSSDGTVMYCADSKAGTPKPGETFSGREAGGIYLDYILYYGHGGTED